MSAFSYPVTVRYTGLNWEELQETNPFEDTGQGRGVQLLKHRPGLASF